MTNLSPNHINPAFHAELLEHYDQLLKRPDIQQNDQCREIIEQSLAYHRNQYLRHQELLTLAGEFNMPAMDLLHMANLVKQRMDENETIRLDYNDHRIAVFDHQDTVIAWCKTNSVTTKTTL